MRFGYVRLSVASLALEDQKRILFSAGVAASDIYVDEAGADGLPQRQAVISLLGIGDELVVSSVSRIGVSLVDAVSALAQVAAKNAGLFVADEGRLCTWHPDVLDVMQLAERVEDEARREQARARRARLKQSRAISGHLGGPKPKLSDEDWVEARKMWSDPALSVQDIADVMDVTSRTLYRKLGPRT